MDYLLLCYNCGLPLNDAVMAGNGDYLCCSGSRNIALCTSSGMICPLNEIPLIHFEDIKKHFDPGGYERKNMCNQDAVTVSEQDGYSGIYFNQFETKRTSCFKEQVAEKEVEFRCPVVGGMGNMQPNEGATGQAIALGKLKSEDPNSLQGSICDDDLQACYVSSEKSEEYEVGAIHEDFIGAQNPCSNNKSQGIELAAQGNVNDIPLAHRVANILAQHATGDEALKPEEVSILQSAFGRLMSVSLRGPDDNRNSSPGKDMAVGISFDSEIGGKFGSSASDMTHSKTLESRLAAIETRLALHQSLHEEHIRSRQIITDKMKDDVAKLQSDFGEMKSLFQRQFTEIINFLNMQTPYHEELSRFIRNAKADMEERVQTLEQRSQSLGDMVDKLSETITKLHLVSELCEAPNVQGAP